MLGLSFLMNLPLFWMVFTPWRFAVGREAESDIISGYLRSAFDLLALLSGELAFSVTDLTSSSESF